MGVMQYRIMLTQQPDGSYFAEMPALRGCMSDGETPNEAVENIRNAARDWIADCKERLIPFPEAG